MKRKVSRKSQLMLMLRKKRVVLASDILQFITSRVGISRLVSNGEILSVGSGIYADVSVDPFIAAVAAASKYYPQCVVSNITALVIHGLADERVEKIDVDICRDTSIRNQFLIAHRVPKRRLIGFEEMDLQGFNIKIYDLERSLCDAYLIDPKGPIFYKALKRYMNKKFPNIELIAKYDKSLKTDVLSHIRQELSDE